MKDFFEMCHEHEQRMARIARRKRRLTIVKDGLILLIIAVLICGILVYIH